MQAFKAANPGCTLEDFVRWYSPPDFITRSTPTPPVRNWHGDEAPETPQKGGAGAAGPRAEENPATPSPSRSEASDSCMLGGNRLLDACHIHALTFAWAVRLLNMLHLNFPYRPLLAIPPHPQPTAPERRFSSTSSRLATNKIAGSAQIRTNFSAVSSLLSCHLLGVS